MSAEIDQNSAALHSLSSDLREKYLCREEPTENSFLTLSELDFYLK